METDPARTGPVGADLPPCHRWAAPVCPAVHPLLERSGRPRLGSRRHAGPAELARVLGVYAQRVMTPVGSTAVSGLELMTALNPPTRASEPDQDGKRHSEHRPGSLGKQPVNPAPCEAVDGHPVLAHLPRFHIRAPGAAVRGGLRLGTGPHRRGVHAAHLVGIDVNLAFGAAANGAVVGLDAPPEHVTARSSTRRCPARGWWTSPRRPQPGEGRQAVARPEGGLLPSPFTRPANSPRARPGTRRRPWRMPSNSATTSHPRGVAAASERAVPGRLVQAAARRLRRHHGRPQGCGEASPGEFLKAMDGYKGGILSWGSCWTR